MRNVFPIPPRGILGSPLNVTWRPSGGSPMVRLRLRMPGGLFGAQRSTATNTATRSHDGVDLLAPRGTPVQAPLRGRVMIVREPPPDPSTPDVSEHFITIDHNFNTRQQGMGLITRYHHLQSISVSEGQSVGAGVQIAEVGQYGGTEHLHFSLMRALEPDPNIWQAGGNYTEQLSSSLPIDPTRMLANFEITYMGTPSLSTEQREVSGLGVISQNHFQWFQVGWKERWRWIPLYEPVPEGDLQLMNTLRDAWRAERPVHLATRNSPFWGKNVIFSARVI